MELEGKVSLVVGAARGLGQVVCEELARRGSNVALIYRDTPSEDTVALVQKQGRQALGIMAKVASFADASKAVGRVIEQFGHLDILVNNAGIYRTATVWTMTEEEWDSVINTGLKDCFNFIRAAAPVFRQQKAGVIVNVASINGLRGQSGHANFSAAKGGVIALTKSVAKELGPYGVNVNCVAPGLIETDKIAMASEEVRRSALDESALKRIGKPEDVAYAIAFLCSPHARHITGEVLKVDGGQYI